MNDRELVLLTSQFICFWNFPRYMQLFRWSRAQVSERQTSVAAQGGVRLANSPVFFVNCLTHTYTHTETTQTRIASLHVITNPALFLRSFFKFLESSCFDFAAPFRRLAACWITCSVDEVRTDHQAELDEGIVIRETPICESRVEWSGGREMERLDWNNYRGEGHAVGSNCTSSFQLLFLVHKAQLISALHV